MDRTQELQEYFRSQIGIDLLPCTYFSGVRSHNGLDYINFDLGRPVSESEDFTKMVQLASISGLVSHVEPNGYARVAVFMNVRQVA